MRYWWLVPALAPAFGMPQPAVLDSAEAGRVFAMAADLVATEAGRLWGRSLGGPLLIVDRRTGTTWANEADPSGALQSIGGGISRGRLPASINPANTAVTYAGKRWTMVVWPLPADSGARRQLLAHELWHRIQDSLGLPMNNPNNGHVDREAGRVWLRLEARALARALESTGTERVEALIDALSFRQARVDGHPAADSAEALLERNEGLAEYTGLVASGRTAADQRAVAARALRLMEDRPTLARSFAYSTGPAYGLLLDDLRPGWRLELRSGAGPARLAARATGVRFRVGPDLVATEARYEGPVVRAAEADRAAKREARRKELVGLLITGPILTFPLIKAEFAFDPNRVESLDSLGTVYGGLRLSDQWGVLDVTTGTGRVAANYQSATVPVGPGFDPAKPAGPGWRIDLARGWRVVADSGRGRWRLAPPR